MNFMHGAIKEEFELEQGLSASISRRLWNFVCDVCPLAFSRNLIFINFIRVSDTEKQKERGIEISTNFAFICQVEQNIHGALKLTKQMEYVFSNKRNSIRHPLPPLARSTVPLEHLVDHGIVAVE
ncbi:PREDICTED: uncharacterized protein LOC108553102 [Eufriesea mexicana]|uniref:uncharacterized protein LOC108553102 n=1 Tax=Eufriesea mexicana TaxID=516756 RepID=UPI00083BF3F1|nr:PREDICTED: uncharacterized protein LOC108553102 [Eufriesea mexicana]